MINSQNGIYLAIILALKKRHYEAQKGPISTSDFTEKIKQKFSPATPESSSHFSSIQFDQNCSTIGNTQLEDSQIPPSPTEQTMEYNSTTFLNTQELVNLESHDQEIGNKEVKEKSPFKLASKLKEFKHDYSEIRKALLRIAKQSSLTFQPTKDKLLAIYDILYMHSERKSKFTESNMLSSAFLKLMIKIFEIPLLDDKHIHELFKITINCYLINFNNFVGGIRSQFKIIFQFTFDVLAINAKPIKNYGQSFLRKIENHKTKTQLTQIENENHLQILLFYLVQLVFLLLQSPRFHQKDIFYADEQLHKLLAFLISNNNTEIMRTFHKNRIKLKHKRKLK